MTRTLIAGIGNLFFGDDGFGVEVARQLAGESFPGDTVVADFGIRGVHLAYELLTPRDLVVLVDCMPRGAAPGTLYVVDPQLDPLTPGLASGGHDVDLPHVFDTVRALGGRLPTVRVVGCEPASIDEHIGLSPEVAGAIAGAVDLIRDLVTRHQPMEPS